MISSVSLAFSSTFFSFLASFSVRSRMRLMKRMVMKTEKAIRRKLTMFWRKLP